MALTKVIGDGIGAVTGNVGIGEATSANLLHVKTSDTGIAPHASAQIVLEREGTNYLQFLTAEAGTSGVLFGDGSDVDVTQIKYDHSSTTMSFVTETNTAMQIDGNGHITKPLQPAFFATAGTQNNISVGSDQLIVFGTEVFDQNSDFDTSNSTFTAPVTGQYHLSVQGYLKSIDTAASYVQVAIRVTNRSLYWLISGAALASDPTYFPITISTLVHMDANDTANVKFNQGSGTAQTDVDNGLYFAGYLVC